MHIKRAVQKGECAHEDVYKRQAHMKEMIQAGNFYDSLEEKDKKELTEAIAESLFFQEEALQKDVVTLLAKADLRLASEVEKRLL